MSNKEVKKENSVPIWEKVTLSIPEASEYSGIGIHKLRELTLEPRCPFVIWIGTHRRIKRKAFEDFLSKAIEL